MRRPLETVLVIPPDSGLSQDAADYQDLAGTGFVISQITADAEAATAMLEAEEVDLVVIAPADLRADVPCRRAVGASTSATT